MRDEKTALIDTVKAPFAGELLRNVAVALRSVAGRLRRLQPRRAGPFRAPCREVLRAMPQATLLCDKKCAATLGEHFDTSGWKIRTVANGETLSLGRRTLQFIETPMVHWPESMSTYVPEEKLLFSMDAFGQHYATSERFDDEADLATVMEEAKTYYANIVMPYGQAVLKTLDQLAGLAIDMIAPSHGLIWRRHARRNRRRLSRLGQPSAARPKVLVIYDTMWESTAAMAAGDPGGGLAAGRQRRR